LGHTLSPDNFNSNLSLTLHSNSHTNTAVILYLFHLQDVKRITGRAAPSAVKFLTVKVEAKPTAPMRGE